MIFVGIDPGASGAICTIYNNNSVSSYKFDKDKYIFHLKSLIKTYKKEDIIVGLELVHSMPKQGVASTFTFGNNFGWIQGVLDALELKYKLIRPQEWKKHFGLIGSDKKQSCIKALELEPTFECRGKRGGLQDGLCDAYLLAKYLKDRYYVEGLPEKDN